LQGITVTAKQAAPQPVAAAAVIPAQPAAAVPAAAPAAQIFRPAADTAAAARFQSFPAQQQQQQQQLRPAVRQQQQQQLTAAAVPAQFQLSTDFRSASKNVKIKYSPKIRQMLKIIQHKELTFSYYI
jgi:hypothetical protein